VGCRIRSIILFSIRPNRVTNADADRMATDAERRVDNEV
jgi:hypothetical protein